MEIVRLKLERLQGPKDINIGFERQKSAKIFGKNKSSGVGVEMSQIKKDIKTLKKKVCQMKYKIEKQKLKVELFLIFYRNNHNT